MVVLMLSDESFIEYQSADAVMLVVGVICAIVDQRMVL